MLLITLRTLRTKNIRNIHFIQRVDSAFIQSLPINGTNFLLLIHDSWEEISSSKDFVFRAATAGRHKLQVLEGTKGYQA